MESSSYLIRGSANKTDFDPEIQFSMGNYLGMSLKFLILGWLGTEWMWVKGPSRSSKQPAAENNADANCLP